MKLSVIIPSYARPDSLRRLLGELRAQVVDESMEIFVVDDGSPEPLAPVVNDMAVNSPFPMRVERVPHVSSIAARNVGARLVRGEYLLYLDDDMGIEPRFAQAHLDAHRQVGRGVVSALYSDRAFLNPRSLRGWYEDKTQGWRRSALDPQLEPKCIGIYRVPGQLLSSTNFSLRRDDFLAVGGFDEAYGVPSCEDMDLGLRLERAGLTICRIDTTRPLHLELRPSLRTICRRQRRGATATVRLIRRFPSVFGQPEVEKINGPLRLGREPLVLSAKKVVKAAVGAPFAEPAVWAVAAVLGRLPFAAALHAVLYDGIVGAHFQRGWRAGLGKWGGVAPYDGEPPA